MSPHIMLCRSSVVISSLEPLDIIYKDPLDIRSSIRSYRGNSDGESNYSDSELCLSVLQKRLSRKSKRLSQRCSRRSSTISCLSCRSERTLSLGNDAINSLPIEKIKLSRRLAHIQLRSCHGTNYYVSFFVS